MQSAQPNSPAVKVTAQCYDNMSVKQLQITKKLQNLYSWTQFYQETGNKEQIRKCQTEIAQLKKAYNQTKTKKNG